MYLLSWLPIDTVSFLPCLDPCSINRVTNIIFCIGYFYLTLMLSTPIAAEVLSNCTTTDGRRCVFPYVYDVRAYQKCTWIYAFHAFRREKAWCGTINYSDFGNAHDPFTWGDCGQGCHIPGKKIPNLLTGYRLSRAFVVFSHPSLTHACFTYLLSLLSLLLTHWLNGCWADRPAEAVHNRTAGRGKY